jgi:predicted acylesterase/phospholipase RssA
MGRWALGAATVTEEERRSVVAERLPSHAWPASLLLIVAVDAETGEPRIFDRFSGASLVDSVSASCAVPGVWRPVTIAGRRYMDGGTRSSDNADLAGGYARILILSNGDSTSADGRADGPARERGWNDLPGRAGREIEECDRPQSAFTRNANTCSGSGAQSGTRDCAGCWQFLGKVQGIALK